MQKRLFYFFILLIISSAAAHSKTDSNYVDGRIGFCWGASLDGSVDLGGCDMSAIGVDGFFGINLPKVQMAGIGTSINVPVNNSNRLIPVYAILQTNFSSRPTLCFLDVRGGISVNYLQSETNHTETNHTGAYISAALGLNLAGNKKFQSFMTVGYSYFGRKTIMVNDEKFPANDLNMVTMRLGIRF